MRNKVKEDTHTVFRKPEVARNKGDRPALWRIIAAVISDTEGGVDEYATT